MGGHYYDQPRPREQRLREDYEMMVQRRQGAELKELAHAYGLKIGGVVAAIDRVEEIHLAWRIPLPPKAPRHG